MELKEYHKNFILVIVGGIIYITIEIMWRGHSHWTMFILGGICFMIIGQINEVIPWGMPLWRQVLIGTAIITGLEFLTGCIVNILLEWDVWDYSGIPLNVMGQICVPYMLLWIPVSLVGIITDDYLRYWIFGEERPHYWSKNEKNI